MLSCVTVEFNLDYDGSFEITATVKGEPGIDLQFGPFGTITGDIPVAIDWNGDNRQETAIFRTQGTGIGKWCVDINRNSIFDPGSNALLGPFGTTQFDKPVAINWD